MIRNRPPKDAGYIWLTRELLESDAWRSQSIRTRRLIDFLLLEHLRHAGQRNGRLRAPHRQLYAFGIGGHYAVPEIVQAEELGLIACHRPGMRTATEYRLTWFESHDGQPATNEWRLYRNPDLQPLVPRKIRNLPAKQHARLPAKQHADGANLPAKQHADGARNLPAKQHALLREDLSQGEWGAGDKGGGASAAAPARTRKSAVVPLRRRRRGASLPGEGSSPGEGHHH
jgi:hypothetical protein